MFLQMSVVGIAGGISTGKSIAMTKHEGEGACDSTAVRERFERRNPNHEKKSTRPLSSFELQDFFRHSPAAPHRNAA
ncbi:MAG: hypothetical protein DME44_05660 [Verrucomicrobia bacterium]|nr:MAG: hypothetical protein DME44_05660 [Verrucomicrobiota bacterium]